MGVQRFGVFVLVEGLELKEEGIRFSCRAFTIDADVDPGVFTIYELGFGV